MNIATYITFLNLISSTYAGSTITASNYDSVQCAGSPLDSSSYAVGSCVTLSSIPSWAYPFSSDNDQSFIFTVNHVKSETSFTVNNCLFKDPFCETLDFCDQHEMDESQCRNSDGAYRATYSYNALSSNLIDIYLFYVYYTMTSYHSV